MSEWRFEPATIDGRLTRLAGDVVGLFTPAQAARLGITDVNLRSYVDRGVIEEHDSPGVFRHRAFEFDPRSEGPAAWLLLEPEKFPNERGRGLLDQTHILTGGMALALLDGNVGPTFAPTFLVGSEADAPRTGDEYIVHPFVSSDWTYASGIPVARHACAIADMILTQEDNDFVGSCLIDALLGPGLDVSRLLQLIEPAVAEQGWTTGRELLTHLVGRNVVSHHATGTRCSIHFSDDGISTTIFAPWSRSTP